METAPKFAAMLKNSLKLSPHEKDKHLLRITGTVDELDDNVTAMKEELESMEYLIRPIKFKIHNIAYTDRYAKFKPKVDEHLA